MRPKSVLIGVPLFVLLSAASALACSCMGGRPACQEFGGASAVFVGTVTGVTKGPREEPVEAARKRADEGDVWAANGYRFAVTQSFLGVAGAEVEVWTGSGGGDCGFNFVQGESYLVYAYSVGKSGRLMTSTCTRTTAAPGAAEDLEFLRGLAGRPHGVTLTGRVTRQHRDIEGHVKGGGVMAGATVVVEGGGESRETSTDARGGFSLSGLKAGAYKVKLRLPEELFTWKPERELTVADRGCALVDYFVLDNGRVSGVVTDAEGNPAARVRLTLADADDPRLERGSGKAAYTDEEGRYGFKEVPPGRYVMAANLARFPQYNQPTHAFPLTYYPSAARASDAEVITLGAGENVRGRDLRLPPRRAARAVEITVVWDDGQPVAGAHVSFKDVTYHDRSNQYGARTDAEGRFRLNGYEGQTFVVEAVSDRSLVGEGPMERARPLTVSLSEQQAPLELVITKLR